MEMIFSRKNKYSSLEYKECPKKEDIDEDEAQISTFYLVLFFIIIGIIILSIIIITLILVYKFMIFPDKERSKRVKHPEIFLSFKERIKVDKYINDCINGVLYDKNINKYKINEKPKISVIIPIYNKETFILKILRSIQNQSFKDIEIIFCDDGSNDNSTQIINNYQKEDKRIILMKHDINKGTLITRNDGAKIAFATTVPGDIIALDMTKHKDGFIFQKGAFLCAEPSVDVKVKFTKKFSAGFFGGEGFILQQATGSGKIFLEVDGDPIVKKLAMGEVLKVDTGNVVGFEPTVKYEIEMIKGFGNIFLGGEGLFLTKLTGPGKVIIQSQNFGDFAGRIIGIMPKN